MRNAAVFREARRWYGDRVGYYLDECSPRLNRRSSRSRGLPFNRLLQQTAHTDPHPLASLVAYTGYRP
jgi:hypothetical protein